ncbi:MAG: hypothetical protein K0U74_16345 [Alphaproteobacteria bacterium]|nr:hypothetical protein [Alphaproteobacteria bacterium]
MKREPTALLATLLLAIVFVGSSHDCAVAGPRIWESREAVVRVIDLPDTTIFQRGSSTYVDLGYKFNADGTGEWVGYIAAYSHQRLNDIDLGLMLAAAKLDRMPQPPPRPLNTLTYVLAAILILALIGLAVRLLLSVYKKKKYADRRKTSILTGHLSDDFSNTPENIKAAMQRAIEKKHNTPPPKKSKPAVYVTEAIAPPVMAQRGLHVEPRPKYEFGRRGW